MAEKTAKTDSAATPAPLISVITATWNLVQSGRADSFKRMVECINSQSFREYEHIIQDGASDDGTQDLIKNVTADSDKVRFYSAPDLNLYDAMNKAAAHATGDYLLFVNSDDALVSADIFQNVADRLQQTNADYAFGRDVPISSDGQQQESARTNVKAVLQRMPFGHNSVFIRRSVFLKLEGHDISYPAGADYDLILRMIAQGYSGLDLEMPISAYWTRGVSADVDQVAKDRARTWKAFFETLDAGNGLSLAAYERCSRNGHLPVGVLFRVIRSADTTPPLRAAAWHSLAKSLKRSVQPWRFK
ncbi:glycosyltransferase [Phaeobacter marinintestinus]|uniref:glycosyltransferase n=1 Tax=Falsiphaeobacter marinintestinus TaxID=1492905 RepID=UPI00164930B6|nr:glycosyltransferase [Phaeobacter marinintestinus]